MFLLFSIIIFFSLRIRNNIFCCCCGCVYHLIKYFAYIILLDLNLRLPGFYLPFPCSCFCSFYTQTGFYIYVQSLFSVFSAFLNAFRVHCIACLPFDFAYLVYFYFRNIFTLAFCVLCVAILCKYRLVLPFAICHAVVAFN